MESIIVSIAGTIVIAVVIFLFQERLRRKSEAEATRFRKKFEKLEERNRADAWHLYRTSFRLWVKIEGLKNRFDKVLGENKDSKLASHYGLVGEAYGIVTELSRDIIRLIKQSEVEFSETKIQQWTEEKKIPNEYQKQQFKILLRS